MVTLSFSKAVLSLFVIASVWVRSGETPFPNFHSSRYTFADFGALKGTIIPLTNSVNASTVGQAAWVVFPDYKNTSSFKSYQWFATRLDNEPWWGNGFTKSTSAIDRITVSLSTGQFDAGTYELFGVK